MDGRKLTFARFAWRAGGVLSTVAALAMTPDLARLIERHSAAALQRPGLARRMQSWRSESLSIHESSEVARVLANPDVNESVKEFLFWRTFASTLRPGATVKEVASLPANAYCLRVSRMNVQSGAMGFYPASINWAIVESDVNSPPVIVSIVCPFNFRQGRTAVCVTIAVPHGHTLDDVKDAFLKPSLHGDLPILAFDVSPAPCYESVGGMKD